MLTYVNGQWPENRLVSWSIPTQSASVMFLIWDPVPFWPLDLDSETKTNYLQGGSTSRVTSCSTEEWWPGPQDSYHRSSFPQSPGPRPPGRPPPPPPQHPIKRNSGRIRIILPVSDQDPGWIKIRIRRTDSPNKNKFWFPGSGTITRRYGSGSGSFSRKGVENCNNPCKIDWWYCAYRKMKIYSKATNLTTQKWKSKLTFPS